MKIFQGLGLKEFIYQNIRNCGLFLFLLFELGKLVPET